MADADDYSVRESPGPLFEQVERQGPFARSKFQPSPTELAVASLIWRHRGRKNPISIARIIETVGIPGLDERAVKQTVADLVVMHRCRIGASRSQDGGGYYWIVDAEDQEAAVRPFLKQMVEMGRRLRVLMSKEDYQELVGQLRFEGEKCD